MAKAKAKSKGKKKGKQAKLSKGKKKGRARKVAAKARKVSKKKKVAKRTKVASSPRITRIEPTPAQAFTEIPEEMTSSVPETPEEPLMGSTESMGTGNSGFTSTDDSNNTSM